MDPAWIQKDTEVITEYLLYSPAETLVAAWNKKLTVVLGRIDPSSLFHLVDLVIPIGLWRKCSGEMQWIKRFLEGQWRKMKNKLT